MFLASVHDMHAYIRLGRAWLRPGPAGAERGAQVFTEDGEEFAKVMEAAAVADAVAGVLDQKTDLRVLGAGGDDGLTAYCPKSGVTEPERWAVQRLADETSTLSRRDLPPEERVAGPDPGGDRLGVHWERPETITGLLEADFDDGPAQLAETLFPEVLADVERLWRAVSRSTVSSSNAHIWPSCRHSRGAQ